MPNVSELTNPATSEPIIVDESEDKEMQMTFASAKGDNVPAGDAQSIKFTLYDQVSNSIINGRNEVNIKGQNGGIVNPDGSLTLTLSPQDNVIVGTGLAAGDLEKHTARVIWTYVEASVEKKGIEQVEFSVRKLEQPTAP